MIRREVLQYGSEFRRFNVAGVTFCNDDGECRQSIIAALKGRHECNAHLERYLYKGEPAYHVVMDGKTVGNVPKDLAAELAAKEDAGYWLLIANGEVHGGPSVRRNDDDDDDAFDDYDDCDDRYYGMHITVKVVSPAEREALHMWVDDNGGLHQDAPPQVTAKVSAQEIPRRTQSAQMYSKPYENKSQNADNKGHTRNCIVGALLLIYGIKAFLAGYANGEPLLLGIAVIPIFVGAVLLGAGITKHKIGEKRDRPRDDFDD